MCKHVYTNVHIEREGDKHESIHTGIRITLTTGCCYEHHVMLLVHAYIYAPMLTHTLHRICVCVHIHIHTCTRRHANTHTHIHEYVHTLQLCIFPDLFRGWGQGERPWGWRGREALHDHEGKVSWANSSAQLLVTPYEPIRRTTRQTITYVIVFIPGSSLR